MAVFVETGVRVHLVFFRAHRAFTPPSFRSKLRENGALCTVECEALDALNHGLGSPIYHILVW